MKVPYPLSPMTIGRVAKRAGVGVETIRFYERKGLIVQPPRRNSGFRYYSNTDVVRVRFIQKGKELGFSLKEIADLLSLEGNPQATCGDVKQRAEEKVRTIEERVRDLQKMKRSLVRLTAACSRGGSIEDCPILDCFEARMNNTRPTKRRSRSDSVVTAMKGR